MAFKVADYPMLTPDARRSTFKDLKKLADTAMIKEEPKALRMEDLARIINQG
jgi:hypothetical protein